MKQCVALSLVVGLVFAIACKSSSSAPPDPVAVEYCELCSEFAICESVVGDALVGACPDQTRAYYVCLTDNACDPASCSAEWAAREECFLPADAGIGGSGGSGGGGGTAGGAAGTGGGGTGGVPTGG